MNTIEHLRELFVFNDWANGKLVVTLKAQTSTASLRYLTHLLITEREYFERLRGKDSTGFNFWPDLNIDDCETFSQENTRNYAKFLEKIDEAGLETVASYRTSEGVPHENTCREMLTHVLFHSMTHRGQALSAMRRDGIEPPKIDYIIYLREKD
jgi:uncharacterized damage-inducible protein DinB